MEYYKELFRYRAPKKKEFQSVYLPFLPRLADDIKEKLELPISFAEVERAIDHLKPRKSPGPDGLGADFYEAFRDKLAPFFA